METHIDNISKLELLHSQIEKLNPSETKRVIDIIQKPHDSSKDSLRLSGNISFTFFHDLNGRRLLILGERHSIENICDNKEKAVHPHKFLFDLAKNAPECLDIFLEETSKDEIIKDKMFGYYKYYNSFTKMFKSKDNGEEEILKQMEIISNRDLSQYGSPLAAVREVFGFCDTSSQKNKCPLSKVRYHYVDLRLQNDNGSIKLYDNFYDPVYFTPNYKKSLKAVAEMVDVENKILFEYHVGFDTSKQAKSLFKKFFISLYSPELYEMYEEQHKKYMKFYEEEKRKSITNIGDFERFKNILYNSMMISKIDTDIIIEFTESHFGKFTGGFLKYQELLNDKIRKESLIDSNYAFDIKILSIFIMGFILASQMDVYFLLRWFSKRGHNKDNDKTCESFVKNSVVYVGSAHAETYTCFFKEWFNTDATIERRNNLNDSCMIVDEKFDFFNYH